MQISVTSFRRQIVQIKSIKFSLNLLYHVEGCSEFVGPTFSSMHPGITVPSQEMSQRWRAVHNTVPDLTGQRFEPQTSSLQTKTLLLLDNNNERILLLKRK